MLLIIINNNTTVGRRSQQLRLTFPLFKRVIIIFRFRFATLRKLLVKNCCVYTGRNLIKIIPKCIEQTEHFSRQFIDLKLYNTLAHNYYYRTCSRKPL